MSATEAELVFLTSEFNSRNVMHTIGNQGVKRTKSVVAIHMVCAVSFNFFSTLLHGTTTFCGENLPLHFTLHFAAVTSLRYMLP